MRQRMILLVTTLLLVATLSMGCASPTIDTWADRGLQGVGYAKINTEVFSDQIQEVLNKQKESDIDAFFNDILRVANGEIEGVTLDEQWLKEHRAAMKLFMLAWASDEQALRDAVKKAQSNLNEVGNAFEQIKRLRRSWGDPDAIGARLDQLTVIVTQILNERKGS